MRIRTPPVLTLVYCTVFSLTWGSSQAQTPADDARERGFTIPGVLVTTLNATEVPARETGVLREVLAAEGDIVKVGQELGRIDDAQAKQQHALAEIEQQIALQQTKTDIAVASAKQAVEVAKRNLIRIQEAAAKFDRSVSREEIDDYLLKKTEAETELWQREREQQLAELSLDLKQKQLELAQTQIQRHGIVAPVAGIVSESYRSVGEWVVPGQAVFQIVPLDRLRTVGFVANDRVNPGAASADRVSADSSHINVGDQVTLTAEGGQQFAGHITFIDPRIEPESGQVMVWAEFDNKDRRLRIGTRGSLKVD